MLLCTKCDSEVIDASRDELATLRARVAELEAQLAAANGEPHADRCAQSKRLKAQCDELERDAKRYRWIKSRAGGEVALRKFTHQHSAKLKHGFATPLAVIQAETADAAIDAAMEGE